MRSEITIVFGASGHGKVVCDILLASGIAVQGFVDSNKALQGKSVLGLPVLGTEDWLAENLKTETVRVALGVGKQQDRKLLAEKLRTMGAEIVTAVHPRAIIAGSAKLGQGTVVMAGALVNPDARIGSGVIVNTGAIVEHDVIIGDYTHISPGAVTGGGAWIGSLTHIGMGAIVLPRVSVGAKSVVGAGAVVLKDVPDNVVVFGVPAKVQTNLNRANQQRV